MGYAVKEIYYTLQGEGVHAGRPAVFLRFTGCNLWTGREEDRYLGSGGCSAWCDTDFVGTDGPGGGSFRTAEALATAVHAAWPETSKAHPFAVCTGGEPLMQLDDDLVSALHRKGVEIAVETNGTLVPPKCIDWVCVSPKAGSDLVVRSGNELKLVFPQDGVEPERFAGLEFTHFLLQPCDDGAAHDHTAAALQYCLTHPQWRLSLQTHKHLAIP